MPSMALPANFVMVVLVCYFTFVLYRANNKLRSGQVGTIFMKKSEETVKASYRTCVVITMKI